jgi:hypothetical protein
MGCLVIAVALFAPRLALFFIWLLTDWLGRAYETVLWPLLGFFFMPYTTLVYMAAMLSDAHAVSGWWLGLLILAVLADAGAHGGAARGKRVGRGEQSGGEP